MLSYFTPKEVTVGFTHVPVGLQPVHHLSVLLCFLVDYITYNIYIHTHNINLYIILYYIILYYIILYYVVLYYIILYINIY